MVENRIVSDFWKGQPGDVKEDAVDKTKDVKEAERKAHLSIAESTETIVEYRPFAYPPCTFSRTVGPVVENHGLTRELSRDDKMLYGYLDRLRWYSRT